MELSFHRQYDIHRLLDAGLPVVLPTFTRCPITIEGREVVCYMRPALDCAKALFSSPQWAQQLLTVPERHYADATRSARLYGDMNTGELW